MLTAKDAKRFPQGQFVSRYYMETSLGLDTRDEGIFTDSLLARARKGERLSLYGGVPSWTLTNEETCEIGSYLLSTASRDYRLRLGSGGARGCDTIAHQAALKHNAPTVAVLGGGCDHVYPSENFNLFQRIIENGGCVVSEHPFDTEPMPWMFRARNRIVAAMAKATLVVEAGLPSGTFSTVDYALSAGREVLAIPGDITRPQAQGTNRMIFEGAMPITSLDVYRDVLYRLSFDQPSKNPEQLMTPVKTSLKEVCEEAKRASVALNDQSSNQPIKSQEAR